MGLSLKYYRKRYFLSAFYLLFLFITGNAQQLILNNLKIKDGLPSNEVYCAFQDSKGFIWFGSDGGVSKYDGYVFKNYTIEDGLVDNVVFGMQEDRHGRIWFRSLSGKLCYAKNDSIYRIGANEVISQYMKTGMMTSFYIDSGDTIWCGLKASEYNFKISPGYTANELKKVRIDWGANLINIEGENYLSCIGFFHKKQLTHFISFFNRQSFQKKIKIPNLAFAHIYYDKLGRDTFLFADNQKLFLIQQNKVDTVLNIKKLLGTKAILLKKSGNYIWLGLYGKGVLRCEESDRLYWKKTEQILNGYSVSDVMTDKEGGIWFTTLENGIYYSSPKHFNSYQNNNASSINYNIEKVDKNYFLISHKLNKVDIVSTKGIIREVNINDSILIRLLLYSDAMSMLITTGNVTKQDSFSTYLWLKENHNLTKLRDSLNSNCFASFYASNSKTNKIYLFDRFWVYTLNKSVPYLKVITTIPSRILSLYQDKNDIIWLGSINGLWSFENDKFTYHGNESDLLKNSIEDIKEGVDGAYYYATRGSGIIIYKDGKYSKITKDNGLISNNCKCIYVDENNNLWVGSKNGLCKVKRERHGWQILKLNLTNNELSYEILKIEKTENTLWLYTNRGLLSYNLSYDEAEFPPKIYFTNFLVNEVEHIKDSIRVFEHDENSVKLSFIGLSFESMGKLSYAYKLQGLDTGWHTTQSTSLQYSFLPPGEYKLYIKAISFAGTESKDLASISFIINKPFWKTAWFILLSLIIIISIVSFIFYYQLNRIKKREKEKTIFHKKLSELEMKALRSQMNPHFIFNVINSIQNYIVKKESRTAQDYLAKFARLIRNVLENSKHENIPLNEEIEAIKLYIELEQLRNPSKFTFSLIIQDGLQLSNFVIPPLILQPYIENAILHGLMPLAENNGQLIIKIEKRESKLVFIIDDNGVGRKRAAELKQKKQLFHHSMGLSVTEDRIKLITNLEKEQSSIDIEDKFNSMGEADGTRVIIIINLAK